MREILQHPKLLGKVPYLLETPKHLPQYRTVRRRSKSIQSLDDELARLESDCLAELLGFSNEEWKEEEMIAEWWQGYKHRGRVIKRRIGKLIQSRLRSKDVWL
jgi:hypothetical protein